MRALLAASVLTAALVAGCSSDEQAASPTPLPTLDGESPVVATGAAGVEPFVEPACATPGRAQPSPAVTRAAQRIADLGEKRYPGGYAGVIPCLTSGRVVVYRVPSARRNWLPADGTR